MADAMHAVPVTCADDFATCVDGSRESGPGGDDDSCGALRKREALASRKCCGEARQLRLLRE